MLLELGSHAFESTHQAPPAPTPLPPWEGGGTRGKAGHQTLSTNGIFSAKVQAPANLLQPAIYLFCKLERSALVSASLGCGDGGGDQERRHLWFGKEVGEVQLRGGERGLGESSG